MTMMNDSIQVEPALPCIENAADAIRAAFPNGVSDTDFSPLVWVLNQSMNFRGVARVLDRCGLREHPLGYHDAIRVASVSEKYADAAKPVLEKLIRHGYQPDAE
jgi:hypothetical protein